MKEIIVNSLKETIEFGEQFASQLEKGCIISLVGDLGAGKTAFTKGIAKGLGIQDTVTSPTFTLLKEYEGRLDLKHIDAYRLEGVSSDALSLYDFVDNQTVIVIEWGEFLDDLDIKADYEFVIEITGDEQRKITMKGDKA